jgi:hypothetical protein
MNISARGINSSMTNMANLHTCPSCSVNLILSGVPILHGQLVQLTSDMVGSSCASIPLVGIYAIQCHCSCSKMLTGNKIFIKPVETLGCSVILLEAHLTWNVRM